MATKKSTKAQQPEQQKQPEHIIYLDVAYVDALKYLKTLQQPPWFNRGRYSVFSGDALATMLDKANAQANALQHLAQKLADAEVVAGTNVIANPLVLVRVCVDDVGADYIA